MVEWKLKAAENKNTQVEDSYLKIVQYILQTSTVLIYKIYIYTIYKTVINKWSKLKLIKL